MKKLILLPALLFVIATFCQSRKVQLDSLVNSKIGTEDPSLMVGVVKDGQIIYTNIRGMASLQHMVAANENTRSNIASTAKQFTALMVLDLSLKGKLSLEDDIRDFIPDLFPDVEEEIKLRHLINHTSGVRDYCDLTGIQQDPWWRREGLDNDQVIEFLMQQETVAFEPGSEYEYSNSGYIILAKVLEVITEEEFHEYSRRFFEEMGMNQTRFLEDYMRIVPNQALPYSDWGDGEWKQFPMMTSTYGEGFLFTTLNDQLSFEILIQQAAESGNELLIKSQEPIPNSEIEKYGFGLELSDKLGYKSVHHAGGTGSYGSQMARYPEEKLSIFVMSSNSKVWTGGLADEIASVFLEEIVTPIEYASRLDSVPTKKLSKDFKGQYLASDGRLIRIEEEEGNVVWKYANQYSIPIIKEEENLYHASYDESLKIGFFETEVVLFDPDGETTIFKKQKIEEPTLADYESFVGKYYSSELDLNFRLSLVENDLMINLDGWSEKQRVQLLNRDDFLISNYILKVERDEFDRVVAISVSLSRAKNNRFAKKSNLQFQPKIEIAGGTISVTTIGSVDGSASDILLTKNYENGNEIWSQQFGGSSYDKASSIIDTEDGYLIVGSTSSYGKGNYDMFVIKTNKKGKKVWQNTFGEKMNEYGYTAEITPTGYLIKGTTQYCTDGDVFDCTTNIWTVSIDEDGNQLSSKVLEEM